MTKETLRESECLQISRKKGSYKGHQVHPFMHCIDKVEPQDSGLYHWRTSSIPKTDHQFYLTVEGERSCSRGIFCSFILLVTVLSYQPSADWKRCSVSDRGQPDGGYSPTSNGQVTTCSVTCDEVLWDPLECEYR